MKDFSAGDILFILFIFCVIHGIMQAVGYARRRKAVQHDRSKAGQDS